jgi:hypothetical protein
MTARSKWFLWANAILLALLVAFHSNLAIVLPARPAVEYWGFAWPPFVGDRGIRIPDAIVYASFCAVLVPASVLLVFAVVAVGARIRAMMRSSKAAGKRLTT